MLALFPIRLVRQQITQIAVLSQENLHANARQNANEA
jgi:hypothetical protein